MDKINCCFTKELKRKIETDDEWRDVPALQHALNIVTYITTMGALQRIPIRGFPSRCLVRGSHGLLPGGHTHTREINRVITEYKRSSRIAVQIGLGTIDEILVINIYFYPAGKRAKPNLHIKGCVEGEDGVRHLIIMED